MPFCPQVSATSTSRHSCEQLPAQSMPCLHLGPRRTARGPCQCPSWPCVVLLVERLKWYVLVINSLSCFSSQPHHHIARRKVGCIANIPLCMLMKCACGRPGHIYFAKGRVDETISPLKGLHILRSTADKM